MPKASVIIPTYNRSGMVKEAIASVLAQTEPDLEIIIVDDGSTDDTTAIVKAILDSRIRYFYKQNSGPAGARNFGLSKAAGEYVAFLDSDDLWPENYLELMLDALESEPEFGVAYCSIGVLSDGEPQIKVRNKPKDCKSGRITRDLFRKGFVSPVAAVIRNGLLKDFRFDESLLTAEDSDFFIRLSVKTRFLYVPGICVTIRNSPDSLSNAVGVKCNRVSALERFYYHLGGHKMVPRRAARVKISHLYRRVANKYRHEKKRQAALLLYRRAIKYYPLDLRLYVDLFKSLMLKKAQDPEPNWRMPQPLGSLSAR